MIPLFISDRADGLATACKCHFSGWTVLNIGFDIH